MNFEVLKKHKSFSGETVFCEHDSKITKTKMKFSYFTPQKLENIEHAIIWLSGLTCNEENFITKAGAQAELSNSNTMIICPDTSPRDLDLPGEHESYDFGSGAGFYVNATTPGYSVNYKMYDYIVKELTEILKNDFNVNKISLSGHSMGGHGALIMGLKEANLFHSVSAFSPIVNPTQCDWGKKAFLGYLGEDTKLWSEYDACKLLLSGKKRNTKILIDQGTSDDFLETQLLTKNFEEACAQVDQKIEINYREGFDHSYYFISSFIKEHIKHLCN